MHILEGVPLAPRSTLEVGGPARFFVSASDEETVVDAVDWAERHRVPLAVLGGGSNIVVADAGYSGLVLEIAIRGQTLSESSDTVEIDAAAGEPWDDLVRFSVEHSLAGLECLSGIPGRVGATPIQNVGAYGQDVSETITIVRALDRKERQIVVLEASECGFGYRDSRFKTADKDRFIVLGVRFRLRPHGEPSLRYPELVRDLERRGTIKPTLADVRQSVLAIRRGKSMVIDADDPNRRSCGSFFVNPVVTSEQASEVARRASDPSLPRYSQPDGRLKLSAAWLIEHAGFEKGYRAGRAAISTRHTLALVCLDNARSDEIVLLARRVQNGVYERFGVRLVPEPVFWGFASLDDGLPDERIA